uniref:Uncharacterized protein LOC113789876 n=1 Tax=Dermatophagoides pteronyssinus TaxID=6956 RepID=A0A6P6XP86_DERPT|nr:uncharacterized protein LOC113789876 [Dermatophagoides pteronyssinus]
MLSKSQQQTQSKSIDTQNNNNDDNDNDNFDLKRNEHRTTVPIRKQSVFISPLTSSTITKTTTGIHLDQQQQRQTSTSDIQKQQQQQHRPTDQDISEHITKLIQENKAIVGESSQLSSSSSSTIGESVVGFQSSSSSLSPTMVPTSHSHNQRRSMKNSSSSASRHNHNHHHQQQQPYFSLRRHSSSSSSSSLTTTTTTGDLQQKSLQYSRLQSALLGDKCLSLNQNQSINLNNNHQQQFPFHPSSSSSSFVTQFRTTGTSTTIATTTTSSTITQPCIMATTSTILPIFHPSTIINDHHNDDLIRKYSWSQQQQYLANNSSIIPMLSTNIVTPQISTAAMIATIQSQQLSSSMNNRSSSSSSSHSLFPSLFEPSQHSSLQSQSSSSSLKMNGGMAMIGRDLSNNQKSVIINATTGTIQQNYLIDTQTAAINGISMNGGSSSTSDSKNCLVRNLLLNSIGNNQNSNDNIISQTKNGSSRTLISSNNDISQSPSPTSMNIDQRSMMDSTMGHNNRHQNSNNVNDQKCIIKDLLLKSSSSLNKNSNIILEQTSNSTKITSTTTPVTTITTSTTTTLDNKSDLHLPPRKRSRCSISNIPVDNQSSTNYQQQQSIQSEITIQPPSQPPQSQPSQLSLQQPVAVYTCRFCQVPFRQEQNLEIHQKYYCCGGNQNQNHHQQQQQQQVIVVDDNETEKYSESIVSTSTTMTKPQLPQRERKVCVLERPSIISYTAATNRRQDNNNSSDNNKDKDMNQFSISSSISKSSYNFGNILKSKLLSGYNSDDIFDDSDYDDDYDDDSNSSSTIYKCPRHQKQQSNNVNNNNNNNEKQQSSSIGLKKRKISEPAFRHWSSSTYYDYDSKRESAINEHRDSVLQQSKTCKQQQQQQDPLIPLEIIPAYMPYLMRPSTKITLKGPLLFPVLQNLLDNHTNYEFTLDNMDDQKQINNFIDSTKDEMKFIVKHEEEIISDQIVRQLMDDILNDLECDEQMNNLMDDLLDAVDNGQKSIDLSKKSLQRPTTLSLNIIDYQSNNQQLSTTLDGRKLSILVNQCSMIQNDINVEHKFDHSIKLIASTLISPDTPRSQQKYQQLFLDGNAYSNLGLKVSLRPTYCCIYRLQPMYVMQEANPQLSMYSQWATHPVPEGHVLHTLKSPCQLLSAYDSNEAVFYNRHRTSPSSSSSLSTLWYSSSLKPTLTTVTAVDKNQPITIVKQEEQQQKSTSSETKGSIQEFLDTIKSRLSHMITNDDHVRLNSENLSEKLTSTIKLTERTLKHIIWSIDSRIVDRICDSITRLHYISTHSNYYQNQQKRKSINQLNRNQNRNSTRVSFALNKITTTTATTTIKSTLNNMILDELNEATTTTTKINDETMKRKTTDSINQQQSITNSLINPYITMHPLLGHLSDKQAVMYIMMMSNISPNLAVPTVQQIMSSTTTNLASRKFSECIGVKQKHYHSLNDCNDHHWHRLIGHSSSNDDISASLPKRIKIFEGGFKSNEDYTYIRGRGRGKYVCGECGIRCKKPSMLKKHIRTHTDLRPYSCRHCSFAFKTKGNLTKHMKSKAHHKKCVELGIIPVPTCIDDSQIDLEALAKQEQYELNRSDSNCSIDGNGGNNRLSHCSIGRFGGGDDDDEFDDDDMFDDDDDDDDEGVPIVPTCNETKQQQQLAVNRLNYVEPGQFDDAIHDNNDDNLLINSSNNNEQNEQQKKSLKSDNNQSVSSHLARQRKLSIIETGQNRPIISTSHSLSTAMIENNNNDFNAKNENQSQTAQTSTTVTTTVGHNENEAEAIHSLLILSSGATTSNHCRRSPLLLDGHPQQQPKSKLNELIIQSQPTLVASAPLPPTSLSSMQPLTDLSHSSSLYPAIAVTANQRSTKFKPEFYGYDTALLKPINSIDSIMNKSGMMVNRPSPPPTLSQQIQPQPNHYHQPMSHPTSVIITNHQSIQHHHPTLNTSPRKRIRTSSSSDSSMAIETPKIIVSPPVLSEISSQLKRTSPIIISNESPKTNIVQHQSSGQILGDGIIRQLSPLVSETLVKSPISNTPNELSQKNFSNFQQQSSSLQSVNSKPMIMTKSPQSLVYHGQPSIVVSGDPVQFIRPSSSANFCTPSLPSIVEQSLNRYVANNNQESSQQQFQTSSSLQVEPIDLSSKKTPLSNSGNTQQQSQSNNDNNFGTPEKLKRSSPAFLSSNISTLPSSSSPTAKSLKQSSPQRQQSTAKFVEHIRQSFSPLSHMMIETSSYGNHHTTNGHQLYQNIRRDEFAHLTSGIHSPHSLPRIIMMNHNGGETNNDKSSSPAGCSQQQSSPPLINTNNSGMVTIGKSPTKRIDGVDDKPTCPTCMKQFSKPEQLRLHYKIHSFERLFRCESCAVSFRTKGQLQKHARSVSHMNKLNMSITFGRPSSDNPRPYKCADCKIAFRMHGHLAKHLRSKMHIMKLECLGKLPFGMYAEMERKNINPGLIDTTDCGRALETLQSLAQKLYDPRQKCWNKNVIIVDDDNENFDNNNNNNDLSNHGNGSSCNNNDVCCNQEDSNSGAITEEFVYDDGDDGDSSSSSQQQKTNDIQTIQTISSSSSSSNDMMIMNKTLTISSSQQKSSTTLQSSSSINSQPIPSSNSNQQIISSTLNGTIAATRSNTCHICFRLFKAAKFLQVHLYSDHADEMNKINNNNINSSTNNNNCETITMVNQ